MARPLRIEYAGAFYHVTSRGNEKGRIYSAPQDRKKFLTYLEAVHQKFKVIIHAYCLMPNHYHLLLETPFANLCQSMQFVNSSYTTYYNIARKRVGHLFQGRYKAILIDKDSYIEVLSRYIHLNPIKAKLAKLPEEYPWSSYGYYVFSKKPPKFLNTEVILNYFGKSSKKYSKFVEAGIGKKIENPLKKVKAGFILGSEKFIEKIKNKYLGSIKKSRDLPSLRKLKKDPISPDRIITILKTKNNLKEKGRKKLIVYFLRKYTGYTLQEILNRVYTKKMSISAVSQIVARVERKRKDDMWTDRELKKIETKMSNV